MWYRVFARAEIGVSPAKFVEHLHALGLAVQPHFKGDDLGWTEAALHLPPGSPVLVAAFRTKEDDLRADLNAHAAELETMNYSPANVPLMERVIQTVQMFTLRKPIDHADEVRLEALCDAAARYLAATADGVYQVDGQGWFDAAGNLLLPEY